MSVIQTDRTKKINWFKEMFFTIKTDRQKMTASFSRTIKSSCWSLTEFNPENIEMLKEGPYPSFVKEVYGGVELCPTTNRTHFQGCVITTECRGSAVKDWLPKAHWEKAYQKEALKKYVMKSETATGEKKRVKNAYYTMEMVLSRMATLYVSLPEAEKIKHKGGFMNGFLDPYSQDQYWSLARRICMEAPNLTSLLSNPQTIRSWVHLGEVFIKRASEGLD